MYGYIHGISSSRKLQAEAERNIEVIWLLNTLKPSYKTIADYRKDHPGQIARINQQVVRFLIDGGWIQGERVAIDGTKLKAYTGWDMPDAESLDRRLQAAHRELEGWLEQLAENDALEEAAESAGDTDSGGGGEVEAMAQIQQLGERIRRWEAAKQRLEASGAGGLPLSDPEARAMRASRGGKPPSYNLQLGVDSAYNMILAASVTNQRTDFAADASSRFCPLGPPGR